MFEIIEKREIAPNNHEVILRAPAIARKALAGQFVILMVDERSERVPYTLCDWDAEAGTITLVVQEVGQSSRKLVLLNAGDSVDHLAGPLGDPIEIDHFGTVALAGGCYGVGAVLCVARAMKAAGNRVITIVEARSHYLHYYRERLEEESDELVQTTIDGSEGLRGHAVDVIRARFEAGEKLDRVIAIGCPFMMMLVAEETRPHEVKTLVALNPIMLDGTGMCGACRVTVGDETKFACVDGPFFDAHQVDWRELSNRKAAYSREETESVAHTGAIRVK
jgi:NAD(P)H-flavin reductase